MVKVLPGYRTGLYYIVLSNLPWVCTWQRLKDFVKNHPDGTFLNVDHAHVYPGTSTPCSGNGWVRLVGKLSFEKAFTRLNGALLDGRALLADGRNRDQELYLPDIVSERQPPSQYLPVYRNLDNFPPPSFLGQENHENCNSQQQAITSYAPPSPAFFNPGVYYPLSPPPPQTYEAAQMNFQISHNQQYYALPTTAVMYAAPFYHFRPVYQIMPVPPVMRGPPALRPGAVLPEARAITSRDSHKSSSDGRERERTLVTLGDGDRKGEKGGSKEKEDRNKEKEDRNKEKVDRNKEKEIRQPLVVDGSGRKYK